MVKKPGKPKSKRTPVRLRHKIEKRSAAKQCKDRKLAKKNPEWRTRLKKDPGIPNLFPFKEQILQDIEERKRLKEEEHARRKEERRKFEGGIALDDKELNNDRPVEALEDGASEEEDDESMDESDGGNNANPMAALLASARSRATEYDHAAQDEDAYEDDEDMEDGDEHAFANINPELQNGAKVSSRQNNDKMYKSVIPNSDIILYVLDARDPDGTRSRAIEREVVAADDGSKRLILILNKVDLVPPTVLQGWMKHLKRFFPTLPLRASTPASNARIFDHKRLTVRGTSETLLRALKSYAQSKQLKRSITVGILGYPNVGKSSVTNALLTRFRSSRPSSTVSCPVGAEAGVTTALREVKLDNKLKLLDSPGVVFPATSPSIPPPVTGPPSSIRHLSSEQLDEARLILLCAVPPSSITDPIPAISLLLNRLSASSASLPSDSDSLLEACVRHYSIPGFSTLVPDAESGDVTMDFLVQVARKRGRLGKGGVPNLHAAAMNVLADWRDGRIRGWAVAPTPGTADGVDSPADNQAGSEIAGAERTEIVEGWGKEFKLEGLWGNGGDDEMS